MCLLLQLLQDQCHNARPLHHYQLINSQKHAEQGHQLHSKKLFDLEFPSIVSLVDSGSFLEPDLSASGSTDNVDNNETIGSSQSRTRSSINITETEKGPEGIQVFDINVLYNIFQLLFCPYCKKNSLILCEITTRKCSLTLLYELKGVCGWKHKFYNSRKNQRAYEVNRKFVLCIQ